MHQHGQHLVQLARIDQGRHPWLGAGGAHGVVLDRVAAEVFVDELAGEADQLDPFGFGRFAARHAQHAFDDAVHARALLAHDLQQAAVSRADVFGFLQQLHGVADRGERVADLVGEAGGEPAQRGQGDRLGALRHQRGVVEKDQRLVAAGQQPGEAGHDLGLVGRHLQRGFIAVAVAAPLRQAPCQFRHRHGQVAVAVFGAVADLAQQRGGGLVGQPQPAVAVHQQHAGAQAADDQLVDLGQVRGLGAAAFGQFVAGAHLPAQQAHHGGKGEVADREHHRLGQRAAAAAVDRLTPQVFPDQQPHRHDRRADAQPGRQQQRCRGEVEHQHQGDAGAGGGQRVHGQDAEEQIGGDACEGEAAQIAVAPEHEQQHRDEQIRDCDRTADQRVARGFQQAGNGPEQHQHQQRGLENAVQVPQPQFATQGAVGVDDVHGGDL